MRKYLAYIKVAFLNNSAYRVECVLGIINTCLQIFIYCAIWKALYMGNGTIKDVSYQMVVTNFVFSQALSNTFAVNDSAVQEKLNDGTICSEFLKPINYKTSILATNVGNILFKLITNFLPSLIFTEIFIGVVAPYSFGNLIFFIISVILGFFILWSISTIVQMLAFWIINIWSISTIKNVVINILAGVLIPLWFMPESIQHILEYTPFESIYFIPIKIYLGQIPIESLWKIYCIQLIWGGILYLIGEVMWRYGRKRVIVQGG